MKRLHGFTLVEVLIALVILATALTLGVGSVRRAAQTLGDLEQRLLAHWVAQNAVVDELLAAAAGGVADAREHRATVTQYGQSFVVGTRFVPGPESAPGTLSVEVAAGARPGGVLAHLDLPVPAQP